jgi:hypothetical protein
MGGVTYSEMRTAYEVSTCLNLLRILRSSFPGLASYRLIFYVLQVKAANKDWDVIIGKCCFFQKF